MAAVRAHDGAMTAPSPLVVVTGGAGFIASQCIVQLLAAGYRVRTTSRSLDRDSALRAQLARLGAASTNGLEMVAADLTADDGWDAALAGAAFVLHVASPVPHGAPLDDDAMIAAAVDGTTRVLRAALRAGVSRVVLTSAFHAIGFGRGRTDHLFTEADWSPLDGPGMDAYGRSKVLAERAAWEIVGETGLELAVINPVAVLGPVASDSLSGGNAMVRRLLSGGMPSAINLWLPIVDVRDVADAHLRAMTTPDAAGHRFLLASGEGLTLPQVARVLREELGTDAARVPTRTTPNWLVRLAARRKPELRGVAADLGHVKRIDASAAGRVLGWSARPARETVADAARSMIAAGLVAPQ
ncbi:3 beta-hydroxysteroid dehydrogenase/Delta 5--_4-isomerase [Microbacterium ginsengisoli]|jgi:nucleoside-diphosphate-sugar epimerase|uniref:3 beta-hydroxysteroid dehydrogenase/Delta 5-->4-isomerase n=3 Tax=Microbacterium ginsengisoli TaxID=400772 RepID=A0A0F0LSU0_9MICO|nr:3 beta-hydroxysteroid dehydrogenase/Delta 5-->4-isomerase [Microbacterium ginsengisoli]